MSLNVMVNSCKVRKMELLTKILVNLWTWLYFIQELT